MRVKQGSTSISALRSVAWNATGSRLATASAHGTVSVWNPERASTASYCWELKGHAMSAEQAAWDPTHADRLCSVAADKTLRVWDYRNTQQLGLVDLKTAGYRVAYAPDGKQVAVATRDGTILVIDVTTKQILQTWQEERTGVNELVYSHAGTLLCLCMQSGCVRVYETASWSFLHQVGSSTAAVLCLEFDPRGRYLAVGGADSIVSLWDLEDWTCVRTFYKMSHPVRSLSFSHDGRYLACGSEDLFIDISSVETGEQVHKIPTTSAVCSVSFNPFKYVLAFVTDDKALRIAS
ncbi:putative THO complex subunit [Protomyces lactucae-debilis]|uniref:Putative THO complex subunit n=1 Tax=Protomyces lactucae-debilis TaxID=2754530 RepID=A0A1Y2F6G9_PROLT|nr:putative THO complex subunit [Protomyces lactucae-debilis]ORY79482.1 putative THO complex subunit [Protomyces lactucae-debilis]